MTIDIKKNKGHVDMLTESVSEPPPVYIGNELVERVDKFKLLGMGLQNNLKWNNHVETVIQKANCQVYILRECRKANLPMEVGITLYKPNIRSILEYASSVWGGLPTWQMRLNKPKPAASEFLVITMTVYRASLIEEKNF